MCARQIGPRGKLYRRTLLLTGARIEQALHIDHETRE
jgi:hypothetical protein